MIKTLGIPKSEEKKFWDIVKLAHWPSDYNKVKILYLKKLSKDECKAFRKIVSHARYMVKTALAENPEINDNLGVGDDGFSDLTHHIVGLGKTQFYKYVNNVALIGKLASSNGYKESFAYCIPYDSDYEAGNNYTIDHVVKMAKNSVEQIESIQKMDEHPDIRWFEDIEGHLNHIKRTFETFLNTPTLAVMENLLVANKGSISDSCKKIKKFFEENYMELPRKFTTQDVINVYLFENTVNDAEKALTFMKD